MRVHFRKIKAVKALLITATVASAIGIAILGNSKSGTVRIENGVTTQTAAAAAGAQVEPTDSRLRIEPK